MKIIIKVKKIYDFNRLKTLSLQAATSDPTLSASACYFSTQLN